MVRTATALAAQREKTGQTALEILDIACEPYRGADAEFDDDLVPDTEFGKLVTEAFDPEGKFAQRAEENPDAEEDWWDDDEGPYRKFKDRYSLC